MTRALRIGISGILVAAVALAVMGVRGSDGLGHLTGQVETFWSAIAVVLICSSILGRGN
jgi:hypothetical protein